MIDLNYFPDPEKYSTTTDFHIICRICLRKGGRDGVVSVQPIGRYIGRLHPENIQNLYEKIRMCSNVELHNNDDILPNNICDNCVNLLLIAHYFKLLTAHSDVILRRIVANAKDEKHLPGVKMECVDEAWDGDNQLYEEGYIIFEKQDNSSTENKTSKHCRPNETLVASSVKQMLSACKDLNITQVKPSEGTNTKHTRSYSTRRAILSEETKADNTNDGKQYECTLCDSRFIYRTELVRHMYSHESGEYKCYGCDVVFNKYSKRSLHEMTCCPKMRRGAKYVCRECKVKCDGRYRYEYHMKRECKGNPIRVQQSESGETTYHCSNCDVKEKSMKELEYHMKHLCKNKSESSDEEEITVAQIYKCDQCQFVSSIKNSLISHFWRLHAEKKFFCDICGLGYAKDIMLKYHIKQTHTSIAPEKKFKCPYCDYTAKHKSMMERHVQIHTQDYRYSCEICGKCFLVSAAFHSHMRRIHMEKEYQCEYCKKMFSVKAELNVHVRNVHLGIKDHKCKECGKAYAKIDRLKRHLLINHKIVTEKKSKPEMIPKHLQKI